MCVTVLCLFQLLQSKKNKLSTVKLSIALNAKMPLESVMAVAFAAVLC